MSVSATGEARPAIMIMEAYALGAIAAIRSLGQTDYVVHACSWRSSALGLKSNFADVSTVHPRYETEEFLPWFREYVKTNDIQLVIPSEGFMLGIRHCYDEFSHLLPLSPDSELVYDAFSKYDLFRKIEIATANGHSCDGHLPPYLLIDEGSAEPTAAEFEALGMPVFIKTDGSHGTTSEHSENHRVETGDEAIKVLRDVRKRFSKVIVQGFVPGKGTGVYFLRWNGELLAEFSNVCTHEVPHTGGLCSLRESWHHEQMRNDALAKLEAMQWQGVAMMEYRWDPDSGDFWLIEMNSRFWAALHLALFAGVDFPRILADAFFSQANLTPQLEYPDELCCRWTVPLEIGYVRSLMKDPAVGAGRWLPALGEFFLLFFNPRVRSDLNYPGDRALFFRGIWQFAKELLFDRK